MTSTPENSCDTQNACEGYDSSIYSATFEDAREAYSNRKWWISFFVRPCCPPPPGDQAARAIEGQRAMVCAREDFTEEQKAELIGLIDEGEAWYRTTPYWAKSTS